MGRVLVPPAAPVRLTTLVESAGCAAKLGPGDLAVLLAGLKKFKPSKNVLVGPDTWDDAGIYRLNARQALVQTVDFFTPIVDDPEDFGAIAAANAMSDVYAMGGRPISALGILGVPADLPDPAIVGRILAGGAKMLRRAAVDLLGGHTIRDQELKFGLAVTGLVDPRRIVSNAGARPGDVLVLTKPIGTGVLTTALKRGLISPKSLARVTALMKTLNAAAADAMTGVGVSAATDVTGYGLMGHARNIAAASRITLEIDSARVPVLPEVEDFIAQGCYPGGLAANRRYLEPCSQVADIVSDARRKALFDPQTSGGLLIAVSPKKLDRLLAALKQGRVKDVAVVGRALPRGKKLLRVV